MNTYIKILRLERISNDGEIDTLELQEGVNLLSGTTGVGKTTWLKTLDYILGKDRKFEDMFPDSDFNRKYIQLHGYFIINDTEIKISKYPFKQGLSTKVLINDLEYTIEEFSKEMLSLLKMPTDIQFPRGNPYTTAWVDISFRMIYRHIYRREDQWGDVADNQPPNEQFASQYQLLGIADKIYSKKLSEQILNEKSLSALQIRKQEYTEALNRITKEMSPGSNELTIINKEELEIQISKLEEELVTLQYSRNNIIQENFENRSSEKETFDTSLALKKAELSNQQESLANELLETKKSLKKFNEIYNSGIEELAKLKRTKKSGIISKLKITTCPACDQSLQHFENDGIHCFLCHQTTEKDNKPFEGRIDFEIAQIESENEELSDIIKKLNNTLLNIQHRIKSNQEEINYINRSIKPLQNEIYNLTNESISKIDVSRGRIEEQIENMKRLIKNIDYKDSLSEEIKGIEKNIHNLKIESERKLFEIDFSSIAEDLSSNMQIYVDKVSKVRPDIWSDKGQISVTINDYRIAFYVNNKPWNVLSKLDKDIFLLSYHYGLLTLTKNKQYNYPGLVVIDLPADLGTANTGSHNYIVEPFKQYCNALKGKKNLQVIITGRNFDNITNVNHIQLTKDF